jgi:hypothetical protein
VLSQAQCPCDTLSGDVKKYRRQCRHNVVHHKISTAPWPVCQHVPRMQSSEGVFDELAMHQAFMNKPELCCWGRYVVHFGYSQAPRELGVLEKGEGLI